MAHASQRMRALSFFNGFQPLTSESDALPNNESALMTDTKNGDRLRVAIQNGRDVMVCYILSQSDAGENENNY